MEAKRYNDISFSFHFYLKKWSLGKKIKMSGTYASALVLEPSLTQLNAFIKRHKIPQSCEDLMPRHATVIWSRKTCLEIKPDADTVHVGAPTGLTIFSSNGKKRLALLLSCQSLVDRHRFLMSNHDVSYVFDEFIPHVTIAYDIDSYSWWNLPQFKSDIVLGNEVVLPGRTRSAEFKTNEIAFLN